MSNQTFNNYTAKKRGLKPETVDKIVGGNADFISMLIDYIEKYHSQDVFVQKLAHLKVEILNYGASQAYSNGQLRQAKTILDFLESLTRRN